MTRRWAGRAAVLAAAWWATPAVGAELRVSDLFADHMVVQRDVPARFWGVGAAGATVSVQVDGVTPPPHGVAKVAADGGWAVELPAMPAGGPYTVRVWAGVDQVVLADVLVGDVWVASGQSNMAFRMAPQLPWTLGVPDYPAELAGATDDRVRMYMATPESFDRPAAASHGLWEACTPGDARDFSAVAYFFARRVSREAGVPVGVLTAAVGSTSIASWMDAGAFAAAKPGGRAELDAAAAKLAKAGGDGKYRKSLPAYEAGVRRALPLDKPWPPAAQPYPNFQFQPAGFYNGMIAPLERFPVKGVIWYQGEADAAGADVYPSLFAHLVGSWRQQWAEPDLPVYFVQLPNFDPAGEKVHGKLKPDADQLRGSWAAMRAAQAECLAVPHTGMAVTVDVGSAGLIHPRDKRPVGDRLAGMALARTYGRPVIATAPVVASARPDGSALIVRFDGAIDPAAGPLTGFELAGADGVYHPAAATVGPTDAVAVTSPDVPAPVAGRYLWSDDPKPSLFAHGLPVAPFRTK